MSQHRKRSLLAFGAITMLALRAGAQGKQSVAVSGPVPAMTISTGIAGAQPDPVTNATTSITITVNGQGRDNIMAQLNSPMPPGVTLELSINSPPTGTSTGVVALDATPRNIITNLNTAITFTTPLNFRLSATTSAGVIPTTTRTITYTVVIVP